MFNNNIINWTTRNCWSSSYTSNFINIFLGILIIMRQSIKPVLTCWNTTKICWIAIWYDFRNIFFKRSNKLRWNHIICSTSIVHVVIIFSCKCITNKIWKSTKINWTSRNYSISNGIIWFSSCKVSISSFRKFWCDCKSTIMDI